MGFEVETMKFEGPLDLMLHLIQEQKLDIFDLDMAVLADQYLSYLHKMESLQLEIESEYLVELSTLVEYKSKKLLPKKKDEEDEELDPKVRLVERLLEYQRYKDAASFLNESFLARQDEYAKPLSMIELEDDEEQARYEGDPFDLLKAMNKVLRRRQLSQPMSVKLATREVSTEDRILQIKARLIDLPDVFSFDRLLDDCKDIIDYIVTFLAVLDMTKNHYLTFSLDENDNIYFGRGTNNE